MYVLEEVRSQGVAQWMENNDALVRIAHQLQYDKNKALVIIAHQLQCALLVARSAGELVVGAKYYLQ